MVNKELHSLLNKIKTWYSLILDGRKLSRKNINKICRLLRKIVSHMRLSVETFWSNETTLSYRRKIIDDYKDHVQDLVKIMVDLYKFDSFDDEIIIDFSRILGGLGFFDHLEFLLENTYGKNDDTTSLAILSDTYLEWGIFDKSLKVLDKLISNGYGFYEPLYNKALLLYMIGKDNESGKVINEIKKKYGFIRQLIGLQIAISIANGSFDKANEILRYRR